MTKIEKYFAQWQQNGMKLDWSMKSLIKHWPSVLNQSLEKMARFADPVTKLAVGDPECFVDLIRRMQLSCPDVWNTTGAGNAALIAISCPNPDVRKEAMKELARMMQHNQIKNSAITS